MNYDKNDIKQEAWIATYKAKKHFDPTKGKWSHFKNKWISKTVTAFKIKNSSLLSLSSYDEKQYLHDFRKIKRVKFHNNITTVDHSNNIFNNEIRDILKKALGVRGYNILLDRYKPMTFKELAMKYKFNSSQMTKIVVDQLFDTAQKLIILHGKTYGWFT